MEYLQDILIVVGKICLATGLGAWVGKERKEHHKDGGQRTLGIISLTACLLAIISLKLKSLGYQFDFVRLISYMLPAISFIGINLVHQTKKGIEGLTTASSLIAMLPIGFCIGFGFYITGIITAILIYILLEYKYLEENENDKTK